MYNIQLQLYWYIKQHKDNTISRQELEHIGHKIGKVPEYIIYDDACHLKKFCESRIKLTNRTRNYINKKFVVDKLHIQGHTDHDCRSTCHPDLYPDLKDINTVVVEQINFWIGQFKYITKHELFSQFIFSIYFIWRI